MKTVQNQQRELIKQSRNVNTTTQDLNHLRYLEHITQRVFDLFLPASSRTHYTESVWPPLLPAFTRVSLISHNALGLLLPASPRTHYAESVWPLIARIIKNTSHRECLTSLIARFHQGIFDFTQCVMAGERNMAITTITRADFATACDLPDWPTRVSTPRFTRPTIMYTYKGTST